MPDRRELSERAVASLSIYYKFRCAEIAKRACLQVR
jgi:hypothetical protein